jgi:lysozyme family protein
MKNNYDVALKEVLKSEGGYSNNPHDPGGPTKYGITIYDYRAYINKNGNANDVKNLTLDQAATIYKTKYWDKVNGDTLPNGVDYCVFDYGVNSGVGRANKVYNKLVTSYTDANKLIDAICDERLSFLKGLRTWPYFRKGWTARVAAVRSLSHRLAVEPAQPVVPPKNTGVMAWLSSVMKSWSPQQTRS